ncbi:protein-lysine N-methyltransferase [Aspergillus ruber CBS 135680]|uniref:Methyltransferase-domain-containing protein n=1 Tax=Aspergillus ruber (strain CBS 135680) TaxID=1388766 RepID=A0A017SD99_ASPRC|nr:uncharacterized protein EURHEDRAFT_456788 [Aspergillus ruber CBS 135680]EYE94927.1 hypothetical protein EURHEDRAFT_456788 [Aspergillus ruber CBS 135680]
MTTTIPNLIAQYNQQVPAPQLPLPSGTTLLHPATQSTIYERMFNKDNPQAWPLPPVGYRMRVLKMILGRLEEAIVNPEEDEIMDELVETWGELITLPKPSQIQQAQQLGYIKYTAPSPAQSDPNQEPRTVITSESRGLILSSGTTGFRTWEAALHLGTYLSSPSIADELIKGKRVLELGAGTGFVSLLCAKYLSPKAVVATDREQALIESIADCVGRNGIGEGVLVPGIWEWGSEMAVDGVDGEGFDVALGADLIYDKDLIPLLQSTLTTLFERYNLQQFIISATLRNEETFQAFLDACQTNNFKVDRIPFESPPEDQQTGFFHSTSIPIKMFSIRR